MENYRAIPEGYMRIGEIAKKAGVTVRTLSYYDKEGLLAPSGASDGGYRLYSDKDLAKLMQILMMKRLGFTLNEIKMRTSAMNTTVEVLDVLTEHESYIRKKIDYLAESLNALKSLKEEIVQIDAVDFKKFAGILAHLQMKNERYWLIKYLDNDTLDALQILLPDEESTARFVEGTNRYVAEAAMLHDEGVPPESERGQELAKRFYGLLMEIMGGDTKLMHKMNAQILKSTSDERHDEIMDKFRLFMMSALGTYLGFAHPPPSVGVVEVAGNFIAEAATLHDDGILPASEQGQDFAKKYWQWVVELTGGDMAMIQTMNEQFEMHVPDDDEATKKSLSFIKASLEIYFNNREGGSGHD
ncbi:MAG: MerR family transcriptional regulator [Defluviitaleaceae bacterium]|nr:MerR family transcriptional regulator [Defluviitaleaceae bacterium]MCL2238487.1 MerR family transcriptional regulator [Defluviitaleaceae bacterium]